MMFQRPLAAKIIRGEKTATRRLVSANRRSPWWGGSSSYPPGKRFTINPGRGVLRVAEAEVTYRALENLAWMREVDAEREGFASLDEFFKVWESINSNRVGLVHVVEFKLWGPDCDECGGSGTHPSPRAVGLPVGYGVVAVPSAPCFACYGTGVAISVAGQALLQTDEAA